jgi:hypothetical protein
MARELDDVMAALPKARQQRVEARAMDLATLKDLRLAAQQPQEQLASSKRYALKELLAQCDEKAPPPADLAQWEAMPPVGAEAGL